MIIGLDLDNTIINYNISFLVNAKKLKLIPCDFVGTKDEIKSSIINSKNGNYKWEKLQGIVYSQLNNAALIFNGFKEFVRYFIDENEIFIISHKTIYGHYDKNRTSLRLSAKNFLKQNKIFYPNSKLKVKNLIFCSSLENKIKKINEKRCDIFIDDLEKVFLNKNFPKSCIKILFTPNIKNSDFSSWYKIKNELISIKKNFKLHN